VKAVVAREALRSGVEIINDISAMRFDQAMAPLAAESGAAVVLMHMRGTPQTMQTGDLSYTDLLGEIGAFLEERIEAAVAAGIDRERIAVDPGVGFGKSVEDNLRLVKHLPELTVLGRPVVMGVSRKSFIRAVIGEEDRERLEGTAAAITASVLAGAAIVRVHDVSAMKRVVRMADALRRAGWEG
jgi:dihydropteroate synthase